jgi:hypothetical protein
MASLMGAPCQGLVCHGGFCHVARVNPSHRSSLPSEAGAEAGILAFQGCGDEQLDQRSWETINPYSDRLIRAHAEDWLRPPMRGSNKHSIVQPSPELPASVDRLSGELPPPFSRSPR